MQPMSEVYVSRVPVAGLLAESLSDRLLHPKRELAINERRAFLRTVSPLTRIIVIRRIVGAVPILRIL